MTTAPAIELSRFGDVDRLRSVITRCIRSGSAYHAAHLVTETSAEDAEQVLHRWSDVPPTTKAELLEDQKLHPPFGTRLLVPVEQLHLVVESSGSTSGVKEVHALSEVDEGTVIEMMADAFRRVGVTGDDTVAITLPISTAGGGAKVYHTVRAIGALTLRIGSVPTTDKVAELARFRPTVLVATPSYLDRLAVAAREAGTEPAHIGVRRVIVATQSVSAEWVRRTQATWGAKVFEWYGNASGFFAMTCGNGVLDESGWGTLHWDPRFQMLEMLDAGGGLVGHGDVGVLVGTNLANTTAPLIRYRLGDEAEFVEAGRCSCGAELPGVRAGSIRRADGMVKFRGVSLWPTAVDRVLAEVAGVDSSWVVLRHDADAAETADLYLRPAHEPFDFEAVATLVRERTGVRFDVTPWPHEEPPPPCRDVNASGKSPRWVDTRRLDDEPTIAKDEGAKT